MGIKFYRPSHLCDVSAVTGPKLRWGGGHIVAMSVISMVSFRCAESAHGVTREEELAPPMAGPQLLGISLPQGSRLRVITGE